MPATYDLDQPAAAVAAVVRQVRDDQLDGPTPCGDLSVRDLLFHLLGLSTAFRDAARKALGPTTSTPPEDLPTELPADWRAQIPDRLVDLVAAWEDPDAWDGQTQAGGVHLPGAVAGQVALNELVVHGWDLARATCQSFAPGQAAVQGSFNLLWPPEDQSEREGVYGPVVEVPEDAPLLDRVIGLAGRDPGWAAGR